ncbi:MAG TPA: long-chain fatty acid--CoA ligase [Bacteroidetes bacterium]|nr:long-chain fatty acid--CoA ligase [Bacteroidota bacterium]
MGKEMRSLRDHWGVFPLSELLDRTTERYGDKPVMRSWTGEGYEEISFPELRDRAHAIARWLLDQGLQRGDRVAVLGENRPEWGTCYLAVQEAGGVAVPVDSLMPGPGIRHIIADSEARFLFVSGKFAPMIEEIAPIATLESKICMDKVDLEGYLLLSNVIEAGAESETELPQRTLDEPAAILYTSGTTGHSKGVLLSQRNIASNFATASRIFSIGPEDVFLSVLPIHHSFEATAGFLLPIYCGCSITYARSLASAEIVADIRNTGVTFMVGVPLLFEKMHQGIMRKAKQQGKDKLIRTMMGVVAAGEKLGLNLGKTLFKGLREKAGLATVRLFASGGGPLDPATAYFFNRLGLRLFQGYGLTETSPVTHINLPWRVRHETVGPPLPEVECRIDEPNEYNIGEICIRGPNVFQGYYKNDEATREVFDDEGWFHTGDLGIIHPDNYLQITGRKKNMLVTGGGKNVYPEEIEHYLNRSPFIAESLVLGVPREKGLGDEVAALIYPDYEQVDLHFEELGQKPSEEDVRALIKQEINEALKNLADYKRIRFFRVVEEEFQKTSTRKIKRYLYNPEMVRVNGGTV